MMQLRQGCRNRTPWWCRFVALGLAAATLTGAAWVAAGDQPADVVPPWQPQPVLPQPVTPPVPSANPVARAPLGPLVTHQYDLADVIAKSRAELGCGSSEARSRIADEMAAAGGSEWAKLGMDVGPDESGGLVIKDEQDDLAQPQLHWKGTIAIVRHDVQGHQRIVDRITQIRRYGFAQLLIEVQLITARSEVVEWAVPAWRLSPAEVSRAGDFQFQVVDANQWRRIEAVLKEDRSTRLLSAPKIVTYNGRSAMVQSGCQRSFVVGLKDEEPQVQVITEGITLQVTPELIAAKPGEHRSRGVAPVAHLAEIPQAKVAIKVAHSEILDVATRTIKVAGRDKPVTLQVPRLQSSRVESTVVAPLDQILVIGGLQMQGEQHGTRSLLVTMTVRRAAPEGGKEMFGVGVNSGAGVTGPLLVDEASFEVHQQIAKLPQQVRRLQDMQVTLETRVLGVSDEFLERAGINGGLDIKDGSVLETDEFAKQGYCLLTDEETGVLVRTAQDQAQNGLLLVPKVTVSNGQSTTLHLGDPQSPYPLLLQPVASEDRKSVQLRFTAGTADKTERHENQSLLTIAEGQILLIDPRDGLRPETFGLGKELRRPGHAQQGEPTGYSGILANHAPGIPVVSFRCAL